MKPNKELLDDLLADDVSPEFRATLMAKALQSARRRKSARRLNAAIGVVVVAGIFAFAFQTMRGPKTASSPIRQPISNIASRPPLNPASSVSTKSDAASTAVVTDPLKPNFSEVETTAADRPTEINDKELLTLAGNGPVALIRRGPHKAELIFLNPNGERELGMQ